MGEHLLTGGGGRLPRDRQSNAAQVCRKCGSTDIYTAYHKQGCSDPKCSCAACGWNDHAKRHTEHLHRHCRGCSWDWTEDVLDAAA